MNMEMISLRLELYSSVNNESNQTNSYVGIVFRIANLVIEEESIAKDTHKEEDKS